MDAGNEIKPTLQQERERIEKIAISYGERYQTSTRAINILTEVATEAKKNYQEWVKKLREIEKLIAEADAQSKSKTNNDDL